MKKKNKILELWKTGMSKRAIAIKVGCSRAYVYEVLIEAGLFKRANH